MKKLKNDHALKKQYTNWLSASEIAAIKQDKKILAPSEDFINYKRDLVFRLIEAEKLIDSSQLLSHQDTMVQNKMDRVIADMTNIRLAIEEDERIKQKSR